MDAHEQKIEIMRKYASRIETVYGFNVKGNIPSKSLNNAEKNLRSD